MQNKNLPWGEYEYFLELHIEGGGGGGCVGQRVIHYQLVRWHPPPSLIFF